MLLLRFGAGASGGARGLAAAFSGTASKPTGTRCAARYIPAAADRDANATAELCMNAPDADAPLIERVKQGDVKAFEMLVVKYQRRIERLIGRMVRDVDLVPDIAQETFIRAYRALPQFRGESAFYTWLYRIAVNTAKKSLMDLKRDPMVTESALASRDDEDDETSAGRKRTNRRRDARCRAGQQADRGGSELGDRIACQKTFGRRSRCARSKASVTRKSLN